MRDVLPEEARRWRYVETRLLQVLLSHAYEEVHLPLLEATELFSRGVGEATDIVEREMYNLADRDGEGLTLRPEGTAGCVRALLQHGLLFNQTQRVFYSGPMFRYERPQRGRYRQFYQIGAEAFGFRGPDVDVELILLGRDFWRALGVEEQVELEINTLGSGTARGIYRDALIAYLTPLKNELDEASQRRLVKNPMRILDSKDPATQVLLRDAPKLPDFVDPEGKAHYDDLKEWLTEIGVPYRENPGLVRGLDYYTDTVFEWTTRSLGAQGTVCAGGRYDGLVERLGGRPTPAAGFALGLDRVVLLHQEVHETPQRQGKNQPEPNFAASADVYVCVLKEALAGDAMRVAEQLRIGLPGLRIRSHAGGGKLKSQLKRADLSGAAWAILISEEEMQEGRISVKFLREERAQQSLSPEALIELLQKQPES
ncbi:MAG: histidine--tRNA ligase [Gammaproteobacteria bacterium]|nr:histidine--tRNA ligase [Gammaproteobacteria bacterium]